LLWYEKRIRAGKNVKKRIGAVLQQLKGRFGDNVAVYSSVAEMEKRAGYHKFLAVLPGKFQIGNNSCTSAL